MRDRDVLEHDAKVGGARHQAVAHAAADLLALSQQLLGVVLRDRRLDDLVADRRQHALLPVDAELGEDRRELDLVGLRQDAQAHVDHLQVCFVYVVVLVVCVFVCGWGE